MPEEIRFYRKSSPYGWLSNFFPSEITDGDIVYPSAEHFYQSRKTLLSGVRTWIASAPSPFLAKNAGNLLTLKEGFRPNWLEIREYYMCVAIYLKFLQNPELKTKLLETGDAILIEDSPTDYFWGCGRDGTGENKLGELLMKMRDDFHVNPSANRKTQRDYSPELADLMGVDY
jgi:hypothetical protein